MPARYSRGQAAVAASTQEEMSAPKAYDPSIIIDLSMLLIGDAGAGKTNMIAGAPGPIAFFDFDKGFETIRSSYLAWDEKEKVFKERIRNTEIDHFLFKDAPAGRKALPKYGIYEYGAGYPAFEDFLNEHIVEPLDAGTLKYRTIAFDSFTTLTNLMIHKVLLDADRVDMQLTQPNYGSLLSGLTSLFDQLTALPMLLKIFTAHIERSKNQLTGDIEKLPLGIGSFPERLPIYVDEIFYIDVGKDGIHRLVTKTSSFIKQARTRKRVPDGTPADFSLLLPYLQGSK